MTVVASRSALVDLITEQEVYQGQMLARSMSQNRYALGDLINSIAERFEVEDLAEFYEVFGERIDIPSAQIKALAVVAKIVSKDNRVRMSWSTALLFMQSASQLDGSPEMRVGAARTLSDKFLVYCSTDQLVPSYRRAQVYLGQTQSSYGHKGITNRLARDSGLASRVMSNLPKEVQSTMTDVAIKKDPNLIVKAATQLPADLQNRVSNALDEASAQRQKEIITDPSHESREVAALARAEELVHRLSTTTTLLADVWEYLSPQGKHDMSRKVMQVTNRLGELTYM